MLVIRRPRDCTLLAQVPAAAKRPKKEGGSGGGVSLADLLAAGILKPGRNKVAVSYKGEKVTATLTKDGTIIWQGALRLLLLSTFNWS